MRIAVYHDLPSGGAKRALYQQTRGLTERGHELTVYVPSTADEAFLPLAEAGARVCVFQRPPQPDRERALVGIPSPLTAAGWLAYLGKVRRSEREIARAIDAAGHDVVLVAPSQFTQAPWVLRWLRTPSVYYCQEPLRAAYEPRISSLPVRVVLRHTLGRVDRRNVRSATVVAANSIFSAGNIRRIYDRAAEIVRLGVDTDLFRPSAVTADGGGDYVLTVGALHPLKGLDSLVAALGRVPPLQRLPLVIVSDRSRERERRRLTSLAAELDVRLDFRFRVAEEELVRLYNGARLVLYAPHEEPFGLVPLEAMACGRPVLGVREGGIPETIVDGETGFLEERDPVSFAARISTLLLDPSQADSVGSRGARHVRQEWTWARAVDELEELCGRVAHGLRAAEGGIRV